MTNNSPSHSDELVALKARVAELEARETSLSRISLYLQQLYQQGPIGYQSLDENCCLIDVNQAWLDKLGYNREEVIGKNFKTFLPSDWHEHFQASFARFTAAGELLGEELEMIRKDGSPIIVSFDGRISRTPQGEFLQTHCILNDKTEQNRIEKQREAERKLLQICHRAETKEILLVELIDFFQGLTGCQAIGVRLHQDDDFPYYQTQGFPRAFIKAENSLCQRDLLGNIYRDDLGNPVLECMCGNVLSGRFDPALPFFTQNGSFWTNSTSELLASTNEVERQARTRNRCNGEGYESVALIPLRIKKTQFGLFQFNDQRKGRFSPSFIKQLEELVQYVALSLSKHLADEALRNSEEKYRLLIENAQESIAVTQNSRLVLVNPAFLRLTGYTYEKLTSSPFTEFIHNDDQGTVVAHYQKRLQGENPPSKYCFRQEFRR